MQNPYTTWSSALEVGNILIDSQHQEIITAVNNLFYAHQQHKGRFEVESTMTFLINYTFNHFEEEEELQMRYNYPDHLNHKQIHTDFKNKAKHLRDILLTNGPTDEMICEICHTIGKWIVNHIKVEDVKLVAHIKSVDQAILS